MEPKKTIVSACGNAPISQEVVERILGYYKLTIDTEMFSKHLYINGKMVPKRMDIILSFGEKEDQSGWYKTTSKELYQSFAPELVHLLFVDDRSIQALQSYKKKIDFIRVESDYDSVVAKPDFQLEIWQNATGSGYTDIQQIGEEWIAETSFRAGIDDYTIEKFYFSEIPTKESILDARCIDEFEWELNQKPQKTIFNCWECGHETHWTDITVDGGIREIYDAWKNEYCGC